VTLASTVMTSQLGASTTTAATLEDTLRVLVDQQTAAFPGRVEISVGALDARMALAPCAAPEPFIPAGTRLWGRATLGVRCRDGARWSVLMPVHVRIYAPALVSAKALAPGQSLNAEDYEIVETELTREAPGILTSPDEVTGLVLFRPINAGTALRREHFRARPVAAAGDQITLVYSGAGFSVSSSGKVRILSGIARGNHTVEVRP
jgi:flagella basal body P-ring formation protein FlgA